MERSKITKVQNWEAIGHGTFEMLQMKRNCKIYLNTFKMYHRDFSFMLCVYIIRWNCQMYLKVLKNCNIKKNVSGC